MYRLSDRAAAPGEMAVEVGRELLVDALLSQLAEMAGNVRLKISR